METRLHVETESEVNPRLGGSENGALARSVLPTEEASVIEQTIELRRSVGDSLTDAQFTEIAARILPRQSGGFAFGCYSDGCIILNVPKQDLGKWYSAGRWISAAKEEVARRIAERFELALCEPPDRRDYIIPPASAHHHVELIKGSESMVVAHPLFLKIRVFSESPMKHFWARHEHLPDAEELFEAFRELFA
jgi:hypothetical protein